MVQNFYIQNTAGKGEIEVTENARLVIHYYDLLKSLLSSEPGSERATELRRMIMQLEEAQPELERERINEMSKRERPYYDPSRSAYRQRMIADLLGTTNIVTNTGEIIEYP